MVHMVKTLKRKAEENLRANLAEQSHRKLKGLPFRINPDRPPKNYKDAMSRDDKNEREWMTERENGCERENG